jgi:L-ascorbate metabolism protein UlaG (beta-lactamase superfamily)
MKIEYFAESCFCIELNNLLIYTDPFEIPSNAKKADIILVSHDHYDHLEEQSVKNIKDAKTAVICPSSCTKIRTTAGNSLKPWDSVEIKGIKIQAVPAYNPAKRYHPKSNQYLGYIFTDGKTTIYHAGDTDIIPEMSKISNIDYALIPVGDTYTMNFAEAIECLKIIKPKNVIPMHSKDKDLNKFRTMCMEKVPNIKCLVMTKGQTFLE